MAQSPLVLIVTVLGEMYAFIILLRFILQASNADYYNPISQAVAKFTNTPILAISKVIPRIGRFDISALLYVAAVKIAVLFLLVIVTGSNFPNAIEIALTPVLGAVSAYGFQVSGIIESVLTLYLYASLGSVIISWVAPGSYHPGPQIIQQVTAPPFRLIQKIIPPVGGLDFSPMILIVGIFILKSMLIVIEI